MNGPRHPINTIGKLRAAITTFADETPIVYIDWEVGSHWDDVELEVGWKDNRVLLGITTSGAVGLE